MLLLLFFSICKIFHHERNSDVCVCIWLITCQPACLPVPMCVSVFVLLCASVFDCAIVCVCVSTSSVANSPLLFRHLEIQHTKSMCSIYIHPSRILCVREMRMALCAWRTITKTHGKEFIFHSLTR